MNRFVRRLLESGALLCVVLLFAVMGSGCRGQQRIWTRDQAGRAIHEALEADLPDDRRRAIEKLSASKYVADDVCVETMGVILRTDVSRLVRQAAACGLGQSGNARAFSQLLPILENEAPERLRPPGANLQRVCLESVERLYSAGLHPEQPEQFMKCAIRLSGHEDRDVCIAAVNLLERFETVEALHALIDALKNQEFAVSYEAEQALERLTGTTHNRDYLAWRTWLQQSQDPFAFASRNGRTEQVN